MRSIRSVTRDHCVFVCGGYVGLNIPTVADVDELDFLTNVVLSNGVVFSSVRAGLDLLTPI